MEPSAAAGLFGLHRLRAQLTVADDDRVVVCLTGSGYRVQDELQRDALGDVELGPADLDADWLISRIAQAATR